MPNFKIGTRGSLLALTQCTLIKNYIESQTNATFELLTLKTQGDQIVDRPLWQLEGKDFFTKELDEALMNHQVDLVVHSYKDLGSDRPKDFELAAITERKYAHDIFLMKKETVLELKNKKELLIGTSSPRRIVNIQSSLNDYLPYPSVDRVITCETLRGNVNTRIGKLREGQYDGIVLALAGLERLAQGENSTETLKELLEGLNFIILPQKVFPSSASQGALAIEVCKTSPHYHELKTILSCAHHEETAQAVARERKAFNSYGGGCHLAVGIHTKKISDHFVQIEKGEVDQKRVYRLDITPNEYASLKGKSACFLMGNTDQILGKEKLSVQIDQFANLFVTSKYCFENIPQNFAGTLWAAGNRTFRQLTQAGLWVNGSAEAMGHAEIINFKQSKAIAIMCQSQEWNVLSHNQAKSDIGQVKACYKHEINHNIDPAWEKELLNRDIIFWASPKQYEAYIKILPTLKNKIHACGLGKTYEYFKKNKIKVHAFIDPSHAKEVLK